MTNDDYLPYKVYLDPCDIDQSLCKLSEEVCRQIIAIAGLRHHGKWEFDVEIPKVAGEKTVGWIEFADPDHAMLFKLQYARQ